jgi:hypothetical protein
MKTDGLGKTNSSTPSRSPRPRDVRSSEVNSFAAGEGQGEGARKHCNFPLSLTLYPPSNVNKK